MIDPIYDSGSTFKFDFVAVSKNGEYIVKAFHPLIENTIKELYINEKDEIIDMGLIESKKKHIK